jgi:hypothetical protein
LLAVYWAYQVATSGQAVPDHVREANTAALEWLDRVAMGKRGIGRRKAATAFPVENVDIDPERVRLSRQSMKGFC